jgi:drug/metabolite transporter (DMT)-like permease
VKATVAPETGVHLGNVGLNVEGLATMAIAWIVFRENVDARLLIGAGAILGGAVILSWNGASFPERRRVAGRRGMCRVGRLSGT